MNTQEAIALLWLVKAHWPRFEIFGADQLPLQAGAWLDVLADIDLPDARGALANLSATGREFPPSAGQVRLEALRLREGPATPDPDRALAEVLDQIRRVGYVGTPTWSHPVIDEAVTALGGWPDVCASDNPDAFRAHFLRIYERAAARHDRAERTPPVLAELVAGLAQTLALEPTNPAAPRHPETP